MKKIIFLLITPVTLLIGTGCGSKTGQKIHKEEQLFEHDIKMGTIDTAGILKSISRYNEKGKLMEEIEYFRGYKSNTSSINGKTTYKYNSDDKLLEKTEYQSDKLHYKKINEYNKAGKKCLVKIYFGNEENSKDLPLWGAMRIYYNSFNKTSLKKWIGGINQFEEETSVTYNSNEGKLDYSKSDSSYATYHYGQNKKIDSIKIYLPNRSTLDKNGNDIGYDEIYKYKYDKNDSLIEKIEPSIKTSILYKDGKLLQEKKVSSYGWTLTKVYNDFNKCSEIIYDVPTDEKLNYKQIFEYNENNDMVKQTNYNYLNEPISHWTIKYTYY